MRYLLFSFANFLGDFLGEIIDAVLLHAGATGAKEIAYGLAGLVARLRGGQQGGGRAYECTAYGGEDYMISFHCLSWFLEVSKKFFTFSNVQI
jgi:hypothetical protein